HDVHPRSARPHRSRTPARAVVARPTRPAVAGLSPDRGGDRRRARQGHARRAVLRDPAGVRAAREALRPSRAARLEPGRAGGPRGAAEWLRMKILGISAHYHDAAAALVIDGELVAAVQE